MADEIAAPSPEMLLDWLERSGWQARRLSEVAGDVSARRYFRAGLVEGGQAIVAFYPPQIRQACRRFVESARLLADAGIRVPEILAADCELGLMLLEDVGDETLFDLRDRGWSTLLPYFSQALDYIERIQSLPMSAVTALNPPLDETLLWRELEQTWHLYLQTRDLAGDEPFASSLRSVLREICSRLGDAGAVVCHRDFMARNLVPASEATPNLIVLDHQDLRSGPPSYDLASLLNDSLFAPPDVENLLMDRHLHREEQRVTYHRAAAQRTLKAVGTFEALSRRGDPRHRPLIAPTLARALHHLELLPEAQPITLELGERLRLRSPSSGGG